MKCLSIAFHMTILAQTMAHTNAQSGGNPFSIFSVPSDGTNTTNLTAMPPSIITTPNFTVSPSLLTTGSPLSSPSVAPQSSPSKLPTSSPFSVPTPAVSISPSTSSSPTIPPSPLPTGAPTSSSQPTASAIPSGLPSISPFSLPSSHPTLSSYETVTAQYQQSLLVSTPQTFTDEEKGYFQYLYRQYTPNFGYGVTKPSIVTTCTIVGQVISQDPVNVTQFTNNEVGLWRGGQHWRNTDASLAHILLVTFTMDYQTKNVQNYDVSNYNELFKEYVNENTTKVAIDMKNLKLPVLGVQKVIMFTRITPQPSSGPTLEPTVSPAPSFIPTSFSSNIPSLAPSAINPVVDVVSKSFALGISLGISGACVIVLLGYMYRLHLEKSEAPTTNETKEAEELDTGVEVTDMPSYVDLNYDQGTKNTESLSGYTFDVESAVRLERNGLEKSVNNKQALSQSTASGPIAHLMSSRRDTSEWHGSQRESEVSEMFPSKRTGMVHAASFSSSNGSATGIQHADSFQDYFHASMFDGSIDELDNYKNNNIEIFRAAVEQAVYDVEGMMMLAVTNALAQSQIYTTSPTPFTDGQDHSTLEAENLYLAFDWWKRNEQSPDDSRREYFQELLNRLVSLVFYGSIPPLQGSQIAHGCATIIGLPLVRILPQTTIVIQGMLKTNNLSLGQRCIRKAFNCFGEIESAAIALENHGFGFVRFVDEKSVQRALEEYRDNEIVIQDVAVSVRVLKSEGLL